MLLKLYNQILFYLLFIEKQLVNTGNQIITAINIKHPNMTKCIQLLEDLYLHPELPIAITEAPDLVKTVKMLRSYKVLDSGYQTNFKVKVYRLKHQEYKVNLNIF